MDTSTDPGETVPTDSPTTANPAPPTTTPIEEPPTTGETTSSPPPPPPPTTTPRESSTSTTSQPQTTTTAETTSSSVPGTTTQTPTTSSEPETTSTTSSEESTTSESSTVVSTTFETTVTSTGERTTETSVIVITSTRTQEQTQDQTSTGPAPTATPIDPSASSGGGLDQGAKVAIGVVVPIVAIAVLAIAGLFFWKKRKAKKAAEEERRKEVEDYSYNPNADPTYPAAGGVMAGGDPAYEMREDASSGYRGWGTTLAGSTGRKASTTMSGGGMGAYSDAASPTQGNASLARADEVHSPEGEILGAMGPSAGNNRGTGVNRGPSNASSSYSAAGRSEGSDGAMGIPYGAGGTYYDQPGQADGGYGAPQEMAAQPVIRDNPARRNTRIENPAHYPQQSAGISQNF